MTYARAMLRLKLLRCVLTFSDLPPSAESVCPQPATRLYRGTPLCEKHWTNTRARCKGWPLIDALLYIGTTNTHAAERLVTINRG